MLILEMFWGQSENPLKYQWLHHLSSHLKQSHLKSSHLKQNHQKYIVDVNGYNARKSSEQLIEKT